MRIKLLLMAGLIALSCLLTACAQEEPQSEPEEPKSTQQDDSDSEDEDAGTTQEQQAPEEALPAESGTDLDAGEIVEALKGYMSYAKGEPVNYFLTDAEREEKLRPLAQVLQQAAETDEEALLQYGPTLECVYFLLNDWEQCLEMRGALYAATGNERYQPEEHEAYSRLYNEFGQAVKAIYNDAERPDAVLKYDDHGRKTEADGLSHKGGLLVYTYDEEGRARSIITDGVEVFFEYDGDTVYYYSANGGSDTYHLNEYGSIVSVDQVFNDA